MAASGTEPRVFNADVAADSRINSEVFRATVRYHYQITPRMSTEHFMNSLWGEKHQQFSSQILNAKNLNPVGDSQIW